MLAGNGRAFCAGHDLKEMTAGRDSADRGRACLSIVPDDDPGHVSWSTPVIDYAIKRAAVPFITVGWRWQAWRIQPIMPVTVDLPLVPPTATL